ncbi:MAG: glycosyltransferase family 9 protein [Rhizobacter sp.]|nr:glycosyltransferase family 9 protein [Bacteriovorax sp.]
MEMEEVRKILVKFPRAMNDVISCFPFVVTLGEEFPKAEINIIVEEGCSQALNYIPFKIKVYERPKNKLTLIETHHYCANMHDVFNIDLFFDLENSLNSAFMGFNFRAKERIGYEVKWNKYLLTKKFPDSSNLSVEKKAMKLLELYLNKSFSDVRISKSRETGQPIASIEKLFQEPEQPKFIMIMLDNFANVSKQIDMWKKFFDSFQKQKFAIWSMEDEGGISDLFASIDLGHNDLYMQRGSDSKEMIYLFSKMKGVIVNNIWAEGICNYIGVDSMSFLDSKYGWPEYNYFRYRPQRVLFSPEGPIKYYFLDEIREWGEMNQVVDQIHLNFKL